MKASVIGMGSIGKRHYNNLQHLGVNVQGYDLGNIPDFDVDFVVIATHDHLELIQECLSLGVPFFVEKPVVSNLSDINSLKFSRNFYSVPNMVACNMRFTEAAHRLCGKEIISIHARVSDSSSGRRKYNHPIWLQDIHEFDLTDWLLGPIESVDIFDSENSYDAVCRHRGNLISTIHGDQISSTYHRSIIVETRNDTVYFPVHVSNDMYIRQMSYFVNCLKEEISPMNNLEEALDVTEKILNGNHHTSKAYFHPIS